MNLSNRFFFGIFLSSGIALAAPEKRTPEPIRAASERNIVGPSRPDKAAPRATARATEGTAKQPNFGPALSEAQQQHFAKALEARIDRNLKNAKALRAEAITLLNAFVAESPKTAREMPEALVRLGELRWESEREGYIERFKAWEARTEKGRGDAPTPNYAPARELFMRVLKDYPWFAQTDLVLYVDGFLASEQGATDEALERFSRILRDYPHSRFLADAHMFKAESYFTSKYDYQAALNEYEEVLKFKDSPLVGLALFKSAWCLWRLGRSDEAQARFVRVFEVTEKGRGAKGAQKRELDELQGEALKYLVQVFTEDDKNTAGDMHKFLVNIGGDKFAGRIVRALATQFYEQAHYERGIEAYELLLKLEPTSPDAGNHALEIARGYDTLEDYGKLRKAYERVIVSYGASSPWAKAQGNKESVANTERQVESQLKQSALSIHAKAQRDKTSQAEFDAALSMYDLYLTHFESEPGSYQMHFNAAEIQFHHGNKSQEAAKHYLAAAKLMPKEEAAKEPGNTIRHDALYNALTALERVRMAEIDARKKQGATGPSTETETDRTFAEALDLYAQLYPNDPTLSALFFRQGRLYYDNGVYDASVRIFGSLLERFPKSSEAAPAGELILDSFNKSKNYENIEVWAKRLKAAPAFQSADQQKRLDTLIVQAVFKQGEQKADAGDHAGAAKAYLRAAREFPRDAKAAQACVNAEVAAQKAGDAKTMREAADLVTSKEYRDRPESPLGAWTAASSLQAMGLFAESATYHEAILENADKNNGSYAKYEHSKDAGYNAVLLRTTLGDHERAIANGNRFLAMYASSSEADEVYFQMGRAHARAGRYGEAIALYKRYTSRSRNGDKKAQALVQLAQAQIKASDGRGADESLKAAVSMGKGGRLGADGKFAVAQARYLEGERMLARFEEVKIQGDTKQLASRLKQKADLLKQASVIFLDTVKMGVAEWTTASLYQVGYTYEAFAKSLRDAPAPAGLSDADKEAYQAQIDSFVVPIEEKSLDAYENGWKKAVELGIYNQWTAKMRAALGRLNAELYPPMREIGYEIRAEGSLPLPALIPAPRRGQPPAKGAAK